MEVRSFDSEDYSASDSLDSFIIDSLFGQFGFREEETDRSDRVEDDYSKSSQYLWGCTVFKKKQEK